MTVFKCPVGAAKIPIAGPTQTFLPSTFHTHLAVPLSGERRSVYDIAGTLIPAGDLTQTQT